MAIRPVDLQTMIPKNIKMSQQNQFLNNKGRIEHQSLVMQEQKDAERQMARVNTFEEKDSPKIKNQERHKGKEQRERDPSHSKKEDSKKQEAEEKHQKLADGKGLKIDIKI